MLIALGCVTLICVALIAFAYSQQRAHQEAQAQWAVERHQLLERIQRPERIPRVEQVADTFEIPERKADGWATVGQIDYVDDDYGLNDGE